MAKTLEFTIKSPRQIKQGDTETTFTFICKNDGSVVDLTQATSITAKIGNASGYLRSQPIAITSLAGLNQGWLNLQPTPTLISDLPAGDYQLEIWVIDQAGTSIYPSDNPLGFTITNNIQSTNGATITTITFDDFVKAMNKAASTIAKGDKGEKGDTGTVDNTGLTTAPAFVALQTQVDSSAVGSNLLTNLSSNWEQGGWTNPVIGNPPTITAINDKIMNIQAIPVISNSPYTGSLSDTSFRWSWMELDSNGNITYVGPWATSKNYTFTTTTTTTQLHIVVSPNPDAKIDTSSLPKIKLEKGSVATPWPLNPTEILTQSDYAKIKAAILSLGGHLS
ncbi:collagen-like protein [Lactiplantibacillus plantarum]|uniref:collagen-like protein n=1 Tax=Lactiplantibacillus plantarum TaxID=1590 RepID=UPI002ED9FB84|nr:collagen-like protein [Lactiplantibacillus plantarum]